MSLDETHDPARVSWVQSATGHADFPIQNLPLGVFSSEGVSARGGIAIGDSILDLRALFESSLLKGDAGRAAFLASGDSLNPLLEESSLVGRFDDRFRNCCRINLSAA
jgi:fumarylacetoacetase